MNIAISMEMTRVLRDTWHAALNHEWYDFLFGHEIIPLCCHNRGINLDSIDLVILAGGNDMQDIRTWRDNHYPLRDHYEKQLIVRTQQKNIPIMGICRGAHFINHVMGGTHRRMDKPYDGVEVDLGNIKVTCHHTIQIDQLAPDFDVIDKDSNGVVELAISKKHRMLGVGWHPERAINAHTRSYILSLIKDL